MKTLLLPVSLLSLLCVSLPAQTSENNERLKQALEKFPEADSDKDGVLTMAEGQAFKAKREAKGGGAEVKGEKPSDADRTVAYKTVGATELSLHIYNPEGHKTTGKVPAIVFFHGGGWRNGTPSQFAAQCKYLSGRGMVAISAQYRLISNPGVKIEDCVEDARSAMRWVRGHAEELGIDPDRIASGGGSAGGHLGACVQLVDTLDAKSEDQSISAKPNAMILFNPAMLTAGDPRMAESGQKDASEDRMASLRQGMRGEASAISPLAFAKTKQPPCIMFFGTEDSLLKPAEWFREDSTAAGNQCEMFTYEGQGHSFFNREPYTSQTLAVVDKFLTELGWLEKN